MSVVEAKPKRMIDRIRSVRYENPVVTKELRTRMRGAKAYSLMAAYVFLMALVIFLAYFSHYMSQGQYSVASWSNMRLGAQLFESLTWTQALLIALIAPSLTAGAITLEREQQTIEVLALTMLSARNIVVGKMASAMLFILMLLASSLPLAGMCLMFGSLSPLEIALTYLSLAAWGFLFSCTGVLVSTFQKRTPNASVLAFFMVGFYTLFTTAISLSSTYRTGGFIFAGLSGCTASKTALLTAQVFSADIPASIVGIAFNIGLGILALSTALGNVPYHKIAKPGLIKGLLLGLLLVGLFLLYGNAASAGNAFTLSDAKDYLVFTYTMLFVVISPFVAFLATGPVRREPRKAGDMFWHRIGRAFFDITPISGLRFMALWTTAAVGLVCISLALANASFPVPSTIWAHAIKIGIVAIACVIGISAIGIMFSTIFTNRVLAVAVTIVIMAVAWVAFPMAWSGHEATYGFRGWQYERGIHWIIAYSWPGLPMSQLSGGWRQGSTAPYLPLHADYAWIACTTMWAMITAGALAVAKYRAKRPVGVVEDWPDQL